MPLGTRSPYVFECVGVMFEQSGHALGAFVRVCMWYACVWGGMGGMCVCGIGMHVCVYIYIYVYIYSHIYMHMYCVCVCVSVCVSVCLVLNHKKDDKKLVLYSVWCYSLADGTAYAECA